jgi:hypothetical protein
MVMAGSCAVQRRFEIDAGLGGQAALDLLRHLADRHFAGAACQRLVGARDDEIGRQFRRIDPARQVGIDEADVQAEHLRPLRAQFVAQAVRQAPGGSLRYGIRGQRGRADPARHRKDVEQRAAAVGRQHRRERLAHAQHAEHIGLEHAAGGGDAALGQHAAEVGDARVVDDQRDVAAVGDRRRDLRFVIHVQRDRHDAGQRDLGGIAGGRVDLARAGGQGLAGEFEAEAAVGAGDEDGGVLQVHDGSFRWRLKYDEHHIIG